MKNKWPVAGIVAGFLVFIWGAVSHMALNIEGFIQPLPDEAPVIDVLQKHIKSQGVYFIPNEMDPVKLEERVKNTPRALLVFVPAGTPYVFANTLATQLLLDLVCGLLAAYLFLLARAALLTTARRLTFCGLLGVFPALAVTAPYWNWYGYPATSIVSGAIEYGVSGLLFGFVFIKLLR